MNAHKESGSNIGGMQLQEAEEEVGVKRRLGQVLPLPSVQVPSLLLLSSVNLIPYNVESNHSDALYL